MSVQFVYIKDPGATLDYAFDWTDWLGTDETIASTLWTVPVGLTKVSENHSAYVAVCRISGGTVGVNYTVTCQITTTAGEVDLRSLQLTIQNR